MTASPDRSASVRWRCEACGWVGAESEMLSAPHPFDPEGTVGGCPDCRAVDPFARLCDEPGCKQDATCGTPTTDGYRSTCYAHMPRDAALRAAGRVG